MNSNLTFTLSIIYWIRTVNLWWSFLSIGWRSAFKFIYICQETIHLYIFILKELNHGVESYFGQVQNYF